MKNLHETSKQYYQDAIDSLVKWIQIDSVYDETTITKEHPFGQGVADALEYIAMLAEKDGFDVDRCDGYCTEISCGNGPLIAVYAHADVVPVSGSWKHGPFSGDIDDGIMYGRGTSDDKGPAIASYYAFKMLRDLNLINGFRITLVIGGNEESGSQCLEHYFHVLNKPYPTYGFTPDGDFPLIYGEKAIANFDVKLEKEFPQIISLKGGVVANSVIDRAEAKLHTMPSLINIGLYCETNHIRYEIEHDTLTFVGKASHGSLPQYGINAALHLLCFLGQYFHYDDLKEIGLAFLDGEGRNMNLYYESELLHETTYNVGLINYENGVLDYTVNFRFPETVNPYEVIKMFNEKGFGIATLKEPSTYLLMDPKSEMIQTLLKCYQEETGDMESQPMAIGGGTYAKESKNTVAFGSHFPGREDHIHEENEKIHIEDLTKSIAIYAKAMLRLGELAEK